MSHTHIFPFAINTWPWLEPAAHSACICAAISSPSLFNISSQPFSCIREIYGRKERHLLRLSAPWFKADIQHMYRHLDSRLTFKICIGTLIQGWHSTYVQCQPWIKVPIASGCVLAACIHASIQSSAHANQNRKRWNRSEVSTNFDLLNPISYLSNSNSAVGDENEETPLLRNWVAIIRSWSQRDSVYFTFQVKPSMKLISSDCRWRISSKLGILTPFFDMLRARNSQSKCRLCSRLGNLFRARTVARESGEAVFDLPKTAKCHTTADI